VSEGLAKVARVGFKPATFRTIYIQYCLGVLLYVLRSVHMHCFMHLNLAFKTFNIGYTRIIHTKIEPEEDTKIANELYVHRIKTYEDKIKAKQSLNYKSLNKTKECPFQVVTK